MKREICILAIASIILVFSGCKKTTVSSSTSNDPTTTTTTTTTGNGGPAACLTGSSSLTEASETIKFTDLLSIPLVSTNAVEMGRGKGYLKNGVLDIVGGTTVSDLTSPAGNNTVGLTFPVSSTSTTLCTGTLISNSLILTAGHCFNSVDKTSKTAGGASVIFDSQIVNSTKSVPITCWQRNSNFCSTSSSLACVLNDIAWVKIAVDAVATYNYKTVSLLKTPETAISATETKIMAGFGYLGDNGVPANSNYKKYKVTVPNPTSAGDVVPSGAITTFNSSTSANAYQKYLTVIGPYSGYGTCEGDSGGPVYVSRNGTYVLAALTQGSNSVLTPMPSGGSYPNYTFDTTQAASCLSGYGVYTTVGNYVNWIQTTSGITVSTY